MKLAFFAKIIGLFILGLVVVFIIDPLDTSTVSTPFLLGIILMGLCLRQSMALVLATSLIYSALTVYALIHFHQYFATHFYASPHPYFGIFQRSGLFFVLCSMAVYLAYYRTTTERTHTHLQDILSKMPAPVVISDATGIITYANDTLGAAFNQSPAGLIGKRYVDHFMSDIHEGKAMRYYIEIFSGQDKAVHEIEVRPFGSPTPMTARLICVGAGPSRVMTTLLSTPVGNIPKSVLE
jgi:PAS domain-containing protein